MVVLVRSMRYCLTSEGEQAVVTAIISLLALNVFVDGSSAFQVGHIQFYRTLHNSDAQTFQDHLHNDCADRFGSA